MVMLCYMAPLTLRKGDYQDGLNLIIGALKSRNIFLAIERRLSGRDSEHKKDSVWCAWLQRWRSP